MTVFKNPVPGEEASGHAHMIYDSANEALSAEHFPMVQGKADAINRSLPDGRRQFIRPPVASWPPMPATGAKATVEPLPGKRQFLGPGMVAKRATEVPVIQIPEPEPTSPFVFPQDSVAGAFPVVQPGQALPFTQAGQVARVVGAAQQELQMPVVAPPVMPTQVTGREERRTEEQLAHGRWRRGKGTRRKSGKKARGKRVRRLLIVVSIITVIVVVFFSQGNGAAGAWLADAMRAVLGPTITAQVESWYLGLSDTTHNIQYQLGGQHVSAPWSVGTLPPTPVPPPTWSTLKPMSLARIAPVVSPAIAGEGVWSVQEEAPAPYNYLPLDAKAFIRPDASHPYAIVTMLQFDMRFIHLHMVAGTMEPGGAIGHDGPGVIASADEQGNSLLAAFNGGFKYADGQYGMMANGVVYVPPQNGVATIAVTKEGQIILGAWGGSDPRFSSANHDLAAWRQNAALLINNGVINPLTSDGSAWGGTILNSAYTWRSGLGVTANGTLIYAAGDYLTALTLGQALKAAGAVMAMQTDINPYWVRAFLYSRNAGGAYSIMKLNPAMQGTGTEYLSGNERDFFYLTRYSPPPPPQPAHARETYPQ